MGDPWVDAAMVAGLHRMRWGDVQGSLWSQALSSQGAATHVGLAVTQRVMSTSDSDRYLCPSLRVSSLIVLLSAVGPVHFPGVQSPRRTDYAGAAR